MTHKPMTHSKLFPPRTTETQTMRDILKDPIHRHPLTVHTSDHIYLTYPAEELRKYMPTDDLIKETPMKKHNPGALAPFRQLWRSFLRWSSCNRYIKIWRTKHFLLYIQNRWGETDTYLVTISRFYRLDFNLYTLGLCNFSLCLEVYKKK